MISHTETDNLERLVRLTEDKPSERHAARVRTEKSVYRSS